MKKLNRLSLCRMIGQLIFFGFDGTSVNSHALHAIREKHMGNVILFARNFESANQLTALIRELQTESMAANGVPLLVAIDHEGGSVNRLAKDFTWLPGPMAVRAAGAPALAYETGCACGAELAACGVNLNLAPVVDLADNPDSAHVGSRSFGAVPGENAPYEAAYLQGVQRSIPAAAKHFPSIGNSLVDLHLGLGRNTHTLKELEAHELAPIQNAIKAGVSVVMTSHEVYPALDDRPGTLSPVLMTEYLRSKFCFEGPLLSDCMEMKALSGTMPTPEACIQALLAGVDLLLVCHTRSTQDAVCDALLNAVESGRIPAERLNEALERIEKVKEKLFSEAQNIPSGLTPELTRPNRQTAAAICEGALTLIGREDFFVPGKEERFLLLSPPPAALTMLDETDGPAELGTAIKGSFPNAVCLPYHFPMTEAEQAAILEEVAAGACSRVYFALYQAHQDPLQRDTLQRLLRMDVPTGAIVLRSPYDLRWCEGRDALLLYDYTPPMIAALLRLMRGEILARGRLPVKIPGAQHGILPQ